MTAAMLPAHPELPAPAPADAAWIASFLRSLKAAKRAPNTVNVYRLAATLLARWAAGQQRGPLHTLRRADLEDYLIWMLETARKRNGDPYHVSYVNNQFRSLLAFYKWLGGAEDVPNPMVKMSAPKAEVPVVPVLTDDDLRLLLKGLEGAKDFDSRRDMALLRMFFSSGMRINEITMITLDNLELDRNRVLVLGKRSIWRPVKFDARTAVAVDAYLRVRGKHHFAAESDRLWLPTMHRRRPLTTNGVRQIVKRRAAAVGLVLHPHMFRHTFTHNWLAGGGAELEVMIQNGWGSSAMLRRYGVSLAAHRVDSNYDQVMGPGV